MKKVDVKNDRSKQDNVTKLATTATATVFVCSDETFNKKYLNILYVALVETSSNVCALLTLRNTKTSKEWTVKKCFEKAPEGLKPLFKDSAYVFKQSRFFHEQDQEGRRFVALIQKLQNPEKTLHLT